jgi:hypothetical protein
MGATLVVLGCTCHSAESLFLEVQPAETDAQKQSRAERDSCASFACSTSPCRQSPTTSTIRKSKGRCYRTRTQAKAFPTPRFLLQFLRRGLWLGVSPRVAGEAHTSAHVIGCEATKLGKLRGPGLAGLEPGAGMSEAGAWRGACERDEAGLSCFVS